MPPPDAGFFRRGQTIGVFSAQIFTDHLSNDRKRSRLNNAIKFNEAWLWGIAKWETNSDSFKYLITIPRLVIILSLTKVNLYFKNGSPTNNLLSRLNSQYIGKRISESVFFLISPKGNNITRENLNFYPGNTNTGGLESKHGNLVGKVAQIESLFGGFPLQETLWLTYYFTKHQLVSKSQTGGKIAKEAKAESNFSDTRINFQTFKKTGLYSNQNRLLNLVSLFKVSINPFARNYSTKDLSYLIFALTRRDP